MSEGGRGERELLSTTSALDKFLGLEDRRGRKEGGCEPELGRGGCAALPLSPPGGNKRQEAIIE